MLYKGLLYYKLLTLLPNDEFSLLGFIMLPVVRGIEAPDVASDGQRSEALQRGGSDRVELQHAQTGFPRSCGAKDTPEEGNRIR